jgi:hypothetical protein
LKQLLLALIAVAIYVQVSSETLPVPIALGVRILTIILPVFTMTTLYFGPWLRRMFHDRVESRLGCLLTPIIIYASQAILAVVLATLSTQGSVPGSALDCSLHTAWQRLWSAHDGASLERIQNAFSCCGLVSVNDMSWPRQGTTNLCPTLYHRSTACVGPWRAVVQRNAGLECAVVVACGLMQIMQLVLPLLRRASNEPQISGPYPWTTGCLVPTADDEEDEALVRDNGTADCHNGCGSLRLPVASSG